MGVKQVWSFLLGRQCPTLGDPTNGQVMLVNGSTEFGSQAHYVCNNG